MTARDLTILGCSSQQPTRTRNHSAYLLRWNNEGFLFDPGEGTQRQFIFANIAPTVITRILISHFHGDHCLGLGSMLMRLNLDKVPQTIHCYYPASGKKFFDRLRYGTIYHDDITVVEHPVEKSGLVDDGDFRIEAFFLDHGVDCIAWRITEPDTRKFDREKLAALGLRGPIVGQLEQLQQVQVNERTILLDDVSWVRKGDVFTIISDTRNCPAAIEAAKDAKLLVCESTYLDEHRDMAFNHHHLTAKQAAQIAKDAHAKELVLTHFSARYLNAQLFEQEAKQIFTNVHVAEDLKTFPFPK